MHINHRDLISRFSDLQHLLHNIICWTFDEGVTIDQPHTEDQSKEAKPPRPGLRFHREKAMLFTFRLETCDCSDETKHRKDCKRFDTQPEAAQLLIWAPGNYVHVYERVLPGGPRPRKLFEGAEWHHVTAHDSCWREGVNDFLRIHDTRITGLDWFHFYDMVNVSEEDQERLREITKKEQGHRRAFADIRDHA